MHVHSTRNLHGSWKEICSPLSNTFASICKHLLCKKGIRGLRRWKKECKWEKRWKGQEYKKVTRFLPTLSCCGGFPVSTLFITHYPGEAEFETTVSESTNRLFIHPRCGRRSWVKYREQIRALPQPHWAYSRETKNSLLYNPDWQDTTVWLFATNTVTLWFWLWFWSFLTGPEYLPSGWF